MLQKCEAKRRNPRAAEKHDKPPEANYTRPLVDIIPLLSDEGAKALSLESAAIDFVRDAFGHLKAIAADKGAQALLQIANIGQDAGVVSASDESAFIAAAKTRQWSREKSVRTLA